MTGAQMIARFFKDKGISLMAGIPGGANIALFDALSSEGIQVVLPRHEQSAAFIAQGHARLSGTPAVCLASSGPGATNLITSLADAHADFVPVFAITGQVKTTLLGTTAFQEANIIEMCSSITNAVRQPKTVQELHRYLNELWDICKNSTPKGPVLLDVCQDILLQNIDIDNADAIAACSSLSPGIYNHTPDSIDQAIELITNSHNPLIIAGKGSLDAQNEIIELSELLAAPICHTLPASHHKAAGHSNSVGMMGSHGHGFAEKYIAKSDCIIAAGQRFDDRAFPDTSIIQSSCKLIHINLDTSEKNKRIPADVFLPMDAQSSLKLIIRKLGKRESSPLGIPKEYTAQQNHPVQSLFKALAPLIPDNAVIVSDVGQHQLLTARYFPFKEGHDFLTSSTFGTMGFGLPTAIGAALSCRNLQGLQNRQVWLFSGDGSMLMNIQEMSLLAELNLDIKIVILNNSALGLVREQQYRGYDSRFVSSEFQQGTDFSAIGRAFGIPGTASVYDFLQMIAETDRPQILDHRFSADAWSMVDTTSTEQVALAEALS